MWIICYVSKSITSNTIITAITYKSFYIEINTFPGGSKTIDKNGKAVYKLLQIPL